jgi:hypothetical protein
LDRVFGSDNESQELILPRWIGKEVTGDSFYKKVNMRARAFVEQYATGKKRRSHYRSIKPGRLPALLPNSPNYHAGRRRVVFTIDEWLYCELNSELFINRQNIGLHVSEKLLPRSLRSTVVYGGF